MGALSTRGDTDGTKLQSRASLYLVAGGAGRLLTVRNVADRLGVCAATVYKLCDRGELPHVRVSNAIRVAPADLETFLSRSKKGGSR